MPPPTPRTSALARQPWGKILAKLTAFAHHRLGERHARTGVARDLAQEAIATLYDPAFTRWDPAAEPDVTRILLSITSSLVWNYKVSGAVRRRVFEPRDAHDDDERVLGDSADEDAAPDVQYEKAEAAHLQMKGLRERFASDEAATLLLECWVEGISGAAEQAASTGLAIDDVRNARRRIFAHADAMAANDTKAPTTSVARDPKELAS